jgi:hypothetical protein
MKESRIGFRLSAGKIEQIKRESEKRSMSTTELFLEAFDHYLVCGKVDEKARVSLKEIVNAYKDSRCTSCNKQIMLGEPFLWGRDAGGETIRLCQDCQVKASGDKTLMRLDLKRRQLRRLIKSYQNQLDQLALQFESKETFQQEQDILKKLEQGNTFLMNLQEIIDYNKSTGKNIEVTELEHKINELIDFNRKAIFYIDDFMSFRETYLKVKSTLKKREEEF